MHVEEVYTPLQWRCGINLDGASLGKGVHQHANEEGADDGAQHCVQRDGAEVAEESFLLPSGLWCEQDIGVRNREVYTKVSVCQTHTLTFFRVKPASKMMGGSSRKKKSSGWIREARGKAGRKGEANAFSCFTHVDSHLTVYLEPQEGQL